MFIEPWETRLAQLKDARGGDLAKKDEVAERRRHAEEKKGQRLRYAVLTKCDLEILAPEGAVSFTLGEGSAAVGKIVKIKFNKPGNRAVEVAKYKVLSNRGVFVLRGTGARERGRYFFARAAKHHPKCSNRNIIILLKFCGKVGWAPQ